MKQVLIHISSCKECPHYAQEHGFHEDNRFCELLGQDVRHLDKGDDGIPIICPLDESKESKKNEK